MHASIEQLLTLRDGGEVASGVAGHVARCHLCAGELADLAGTRAALRALPQVAPPADRWRDIAARLDRADSRNPWTHLAAAVGMAACLGLAALLLLRDPGPRLPAGSAVPAPVQVASVEPSPSLTRAAPPQTLRAESRRLEAVLGDYRRQQPRIESPGLAGTVRGLEEQVALVDYGLSYGDEVSLDEEHQDQLWQQRVDLMNSIVQLRGAELRRVEYLEGLR